MDLKINQMSLMHYGINVEDSKTLISIFEKTLEDLEITLEEYNNSPKFRQGRIFLGLIEKFKNRDIVKLRNILLKYGYGNKVDTIFPDDILDETP